MKLNLGCLIHYMLLLICAAPVYAQTNASNPKSKNEIGLVIGAAELPSIGLADQGAIRFNSSLAFGAEYDRHLLGQSSGISAGIDFVASPFDVKASYPAANVSPEYAYLFLSPRVKLKLNQGGFLQPWLLFGGGYGDFAPAEPRSGGVKVAGAGNTGVLEFGGGLDSRPLLSLGDIPLIGRLPIGARLGVRDFYSGQPRFGVPTDSSHQNTVLFTGGILLRF